MPSSRIYPASQKLHPITGKQDVEKNNLSQRSKPLDPIKKGARYTQPETSSSSSLELFSNMKYLKTATLVSGEAPSNSIESKSKQDSSDNSNSEGSNNSDSLEDIEVPVCCTIQ